MKQSDALSGLDGPTFIINEDGDTTLHIDNLSALWGDAVENRVLGVSDVAVSGLRGRSQPT